MPRSRVAIPSVPPRVPSRIGPELFIGLVGAVGTELEKVTDFLAEALKPFGYSSSRIRLAELLHSIPRYKNLPIRYVDEYINSHMTAGDEFRKALVRSDAVASLAISRVSAEKQQAGKAIGQPIANRAYIFRSLKNPEEIKTLRQVYGDSFYLVAAYSPYHQRRAHLAKRIAKSRNKFPFDRHFPAAEYLINRDQEEVGLNHGQNTRDSFHRADVFLDMSETPILRSSIQRFVELLFGNTFHTPTRAEYAMFHAHAAALRSAELGRQVGAAISTEEGDIVAVGTNEVPKAGGGLYWCDDRPDKREFMEGTDSNDEHKRNVIAEMLLNLQEGGWFTRRISRLGMDDLLKLALDPAGPVIPKDSKIRHLIEFGRAVHAEMAALTDAARRGVPVADCIMYVTTFPCHLCARQIVAAGIKKLIYIEPYAKSLAAELYPDSIVVDGPQRAAIQVPFDPFVGLAPRQYLRLFAMNRRKTESGEVLAFDAPNAELRYHDLHTVYLDKEAEIVENLGDIIGRSRFLNKPTSWRQNAERGLVFEGGRQSSRTGK